MIICDKCYKEITQEEKLMECLPSTVVSENRTELAENDEILRYCTDCWLEIIDFLYSDT